MLDARDTGCLGTVAMVLEILENCRLVGSNGILRTARGPSAAVVRRLHENLVGEAIDDLDVLARVVAAWRSAEDRESWSRVNEVDHHILEGALARATATCRQGLNDHETVFDFALPAVAVAREVLTHNFAEWTFRRSTEGTFLPLLRRELDSALPDPHRLSYFDLN